MPGSENVVLTSMAKSPVEQWLDRVDENAPIEKRPTPPPEYGPLYEGWEEDAERREKEEFRDSSPGSFSTPSIKSGEGRRLYDENPYRPDADTSDTETEILESIRRLFGDEEEDDADESRGWHTPKSENPAWLPVEHGFLIDLFRHPVLLSISSMASLPPPEHPHLYPTRRWSLERMIDLSFLECVVTLLLGLVVVFLTEVVEIDRRIADVLPDWWPGHGEDE